MGIGVGTAGGSLGVSEKDMARIRADAAGRRISTVVIGGVGTIAAMVAGYVSAHLLYYEPDVDGGTYPYVQPLAVMGATARMSGRSIVGIAAAMVTGFVLLFATTAAAYTRDPVVIMYSAYDGR